ncbi:hypothetical protein GCM10022381_03530 [Leifsonia kafniensis]|uniref:Uncharacterized protein n=1 Tax=Leifsonia kafniensis TaxID=475957 RepID=A0ABP7K1Q2_9MICO
MTETTRPRVVQSYLSELDTALIGVADATARDIRAGIAEELTGLDAPTAALRIEQLGDPFFIAAAGSSERCRPRPAIHPESLSTKRTPKRPEPTGRPRFRRDSARHP